MRKVLAHVVIHPIVKEFLNRKAIELNRSVGWLIESLVYDKHKQELPPGFEPGQKAWLPDDGTEGQ